MNGNNQQKQKKENANKKFTVKKKNQNKREPLRPSVDYVPTQYENMLSQGYGKTLALNPQAVNFGRVLADPFLVDGARWPVLPMVSTSLERFYATGKGSTNANGNGWIVVSPLYFAANNGNGVAYSSNASGDPINNGPSLANSNSPHSLSDYRDDTGFYTVRCVALGIRLRYTGTTLNAAGTVITAQAQPLGDGLSGRIYSELKLFQGMKEYNFKKPDWHGIVRLPESNRDSEFADYDWGSSRWIFPNTDSHPYDENNRICMYVSGTAGEQPFEFEVCGHYEIYGTNLVRRGVTLSDATGTESVINALSLRRHKDTTTPEHNIGGTFEKFVGFLKAVGKKVLPIASTFLTGLL